MDLTILKAFVILGFMVLTVKYSVPILEFMVLIFEYFIPKPLTESEKIIDNEILKIINDKINMFRDANFAYEYINDGEYINHISINTYNFTITVNHIISYVSPKTCKILKKAFKNHKKIALQEKEERIFQIKEEVLKIINNKINMFHTPLTLYKYIYDSSFIYEYTDNDSNEYIKHIFIDTKEFAIMVNHEVSYISPKTCKIFKKALKDYEKIVLQKKEERALQIKRELAQKIQDR